MNGNVVSPEPEVLRSDVIERVRSLDVENVLVLHRVLLELEKQRLWREISEDADADHRAGLFNNLPELVREARQSINKLG
jgi:hypothetical protein